MFVIISILIHQHFQQNYDEKRSFHKKKKKILAVVYISVALVLAMETGTQKEEKNHNGYQLYNMLPAAIVHTYITCIHPVVRDEMSVSRYTGEGKEELARGKDTIQIDETRYVRYDGSGSAKTRSTTKRKMIKRKKIRSLYTYIGAVQVLHKEDMLLEKKNNNKIRN